MKAHLHYHSISHPAGHSHIITWGSASRQGNKRRSLIIVPKIEACDYYKHKVLYGKKTRYTVGKSYFCSLLMITSFFYRKAYDLCKGGFFKYLLTTQSSCSTWTHLCVILEVWFQLTPLTLILLFSIIIHLS